MYAAQCNNSPHPLIHDNIYFHLISNIYLHSQGIEVSLIYNDEEFTATDMHTTAITNKNEQNK